MRAFTDPLASFSFTVQQLSLSAFYVALITLLYWRRPSSLLAKLAPAGKMGLTVYLTQTAFGVLLFYGIGLGMLGHMGVAAAAGCAIAFYGRADWSLAHWWMSRFSLGPVEWLWRSLTYFKWQPAMTTAQLSMSAESYLRGKWISALEASACRRAGHRCSAMTVKLLACGRVPTGEESGSMARIWKSALLTTRS